MPLPQSPVPPSTCSKSAQLAPPLTRSPPVRLLAAGASKGVAAAKNQVAQPNLNQYHGINKV